MARKKKPDYPVWVCDSCGTKYGRWYQCDVEAPKQHCATYHYGACDVCNAKKIPVTEPRDYGHLINGWEQEKLSICK